MGLTKKRVHYKPFEYPWAYEIYKTQNEHHWVPGEVVLGEDVQDFNSKLTPGQKNLLTNIFKFFTQADVDVAGAYATHYLPRFKPPEIRMMLSSFANMEAVHQDAYSLLLETLGLPDDEYMAFMDIKEMMNKHEYLLDFTSDDPRSQALTLAVFSGLVEGVQLFSSFAILLSFTRFGLMKGMGDIVTWSIRDESLHVAGMSQLFKTFIRENPTIFDDTLKCQIYSAAERIVSLENDFIDVCFEGAEAPDLKKEDVKTYVRYVADRRLLGLGLKPIFVQKTHPLEWLDMMLASVDCTNFFEGTVTGYAKGTTIGEWYGDVFHKRKK